MGDVQGDKKWSDRFLSEIKRCLGQFLISEADITEDREHNTDLTILELKPYRIACRIRRDEYREKYGSEFTIRSLRQTGSKTELTKIMEGWGDYIFYGFGNDERLTQWFIGDLKAFRHWFYYEWKKNNEPPGIQKSNLDGSSDFRVFKKDVIPGFIVAEQAA